MCCSVGMTSCMGTGCGYCSECVGSATCNTTLCSSCITGALGSAPVCTPTPGSGPCICTNTATSCASFCIADLPYAGTDANGNDIYQNPDGSLRYADGSPATRADIAYNCGACQGTPCSPMRCGTTDQPPHACQVSSKGPTGGGAGGGSAKSAQGQSRGTPGNCVAAKLSQAMNRLGSTFASLFSGGTRTSAGNVLPGQSVQRSQTGVSSTGFLLVILVVGALLLVMAFGHKPVPD